jgi:hypothetical protein
MMTFSSSKIENEDSMTRLMTVSLALGSLALSGPPGENAAQTALPVELVTVRAAPAGDRHAPGGHG